MLRRIFLLLATPALCAQATVTSYSPPVGGITISVPAGQTRSIALPLLHEAVGAGAMRGKITAIGTNYVDASDANWTAGSLSNSTNPYYLRVLSGNAEGRELLVTTSTNTSTRVYLNTDGVGLTLAGGPLSDDIYELVLADTLSSLFGSTILQGGPDAQTADNVKVWSGADWLIFYYNTTRSRWELQSDTSASPSRDNYVLRPDRGFMITRRSASALKLYVTGRVPMHAPKPAHSLPGVTFLSDGIPTNMTLASLELQNRAAGWLAAPDGTTALAAADLIKVWSGADWFVFYYNSVRNRWELTTDSASTPNRDTYAIPAGRPILIRRLGTTGNAGEKLISLPLPYST